MKALAIAALIFLAVIPIEKDRPQRAVQHKVETRIIWYEEDGTIFLQCYVQNNSRRQVNGYNLILETEDWDGKRKEQEYIGPRDVKKILPGESEQWEIQIPTDEKGIADIWIKDFKVDASRMHIYKSTYFLLILLLVVGIAAGVT